MLLNLAQYTIAGSSVQTFEKTIESTLRLLRKYFYKTKRTTTESTLGPDIVEALLCYSIL